MKFYSYNKDTSIVNFSNSILKRFGVKPFHNTIPEIDTLIKNKKKICVVLLDGNGEAIQNRTLNKDDSIIKNRYMLMSSTFPPTTVAATTALLSGKYPCETGWIGWTTYVDGLNQVVEMFTSRDYITKKKVSINNVCFGLYPFKSIFELIKEKNPTVTTDQVRFLDTDPSDAQSVDELFIRTDAAIKNMNEGFIYCYSMEPDHSLHAYGSASQTVKNLAKKLNDKMQELADNNPDTLFFTIADHSHILVQPIYCSDFPDFFETLDRCFVVEARAAAFKVKPGKEKEFIQCYKKYFKNDFVLVTKKYILKKHLFGFGENFNGFENILGDFMLIATKNKYFVYNHSRDNHEPFISTHAGGTKEENIIAISVYNKKTATKI